MKQCMVLAFLLLAATGFAARTDSDQRVTQPVLETQPVSASFLQMSPAEKANARISIELGSNDPAALALGREVEGLWNDGQFDDALAALRELEALVGPEQVCIGNSWREPVPTWQTTLWGNDVRIGNRDSLLEVSFDVHRPTGNLFAVFRCGALATNIRLSVCISTNGGSTWAETFTWFGGEQIRSLDAAMLRNHLYIAYGYAGNPTQSRMRRVTAATGAEAMFNNGASFVTACTLAAPDSVKELALVGNHNGLNNRLYLTTLATGGALKWSWDDTGAVSWLQYATGVADASHGLSATENQGFDSTFFFCSFYTAESMKVYANATAFKRRLAVATTGTMTEISAYEDTVICIYDYRTYTPYRVRYHINYGDVASWPNAYMSDTTVTAEAPGITARGGGGFGALFRHYSSPRELRFRQRGYPNGVWSAPVVVGDHDPYWFRPGIEFLGSGAFGIAYISRNQPQVRSAWFDRTDWTGIRQDSRLLAEHDILRCSPNPLSGRGRVSFTLERAAPVTVSLYDGTGRVVRRLVNGERPAGRHTVQFDAAGLTAGVYFLRAEALDQGVTIPVTVVR